MKSTVRLAFLLSLFALAGCSPSADAGAAPQGAEKAGSGGNDAGNGGNGEPKATLNFESRVLNEGSAQWEFYYTWSEEFRGQTHDFECSGPFRIYLDVEDNDDLFVVLTEREYCHTPRAIGDRRYQIDADGNIGNHDLAATTNNGGYLTENEFFIHSEAGCIYEFHFQIDENDMGTMRDSKSSDCSGMDAHETLIRPYEGE